MFNCTYLALFFGFLNVFLKKSYGCVFNEETIKNIKMHSAVCVEINYQISFLEIKSKINKSLKYKEIIINFKNFSLLNKPLFEGTQITTLNLDRNKIEKLSN